ncbi:MAG: oxygen-independent coproporphyrinogen III oxidase [Desulfuromonadales bacterium]
MYVTQLHEAIRRKYDISLYNYGSLIYNEYPHKSCWNPEFSEGDYRNILDSLGTTGNPLLLYIHIPFCPRQCFYCLCNTIITSDHDTIRRYLDHLESEIALITDIFKKSGSKPSFRRVHLGGGSPSFLKHPDFDRLLSSLGSLMNVSALDEFTLEVDVRGLAEQDLLYFRSKGVTRLSFGIQDLDSDVQRAINRIQPPDMVRSLLTPAVRSAFNSINFDLLCGLPKQTSESFSRTLDTVLEFAPDRIMLMFLSYAPEVKKHQRHMKPAVIPDMDSRMEVYDLAVERLLKHGYIRIGVDHFAIHNNDLTQAMHNKSIRWNTLGYVPEQVLDILGIGIGSSSFLASSCYAQNVYDMAEYEKAVSSGFLPLLRGHLLSDEDRLRNELMNEIRCYLTVDIPAFSLRHHFNFTEYFAREWSDLKALEDDGLVRLADNRLTVTELGRNYTGIILRIFDTYRRKAD